MFDNKINTELEPRLVFFNQKLLTDLSEKKYGTDIAKYLKHDGQVTVQVEEKPEKFIMNVISKDSENKIQGSSQYYFDKTGRQINNRGFENGDEASHIHELKDIREALLNNRRAEQIAD